MSKVGNAPSANGESTLPLLAAAFADLIAVTVFMAIGRVNHHHGFDPLSFLQSWWPFAVGAAAGWSICYLYSHVRSSEMLRSDFHPERMPTGIVVWIVTVAVGMMLRWILHQGTEVSFIIVATCALGLFLLGWRIGLRLVRVRQRGALPTI
ncbi:hypothetical protein GOEFS_018_00310 [Gordonia effusa NBRC 100432]|uniref:DUF3054 domain-containing protein n=1 Tax=Gordonia effusa NBRC 100432 TaxID=1077974 RepID=H0QVZ7_9ACTN|nr:DUF3054 domain-containing protein [Gordonia effusa]GAB16998.1 hypothetical protein GOEFS_018_00310 [Gordonia effusa NBRC 100432]